MADAFPRIMTPHPPHSPPKSPPKIKSKPTKQMADLRAGLHIKKPADSEHFPMCIALGDDRIESYFRPIRELGSGAFGTVNLSELTPLGLRLLQHKLKNKGIVIPAHVAVKKIRNARALKQFLIDEIYFLSQYHFTYSINYYGCFENRAGELFIVMEYFKGGDLFDYIEESAKLIDKYLKIGAKGIDGYLAATGKGDLSEMIDAKVEIAKKIALAINELHDNSIVHRDIKPENVLYNQSTGEIRLIDFGLACSIIRKIGRCETNDVGTPSYIDPNFEKLGPVKWTPSVPELYAADWWSYGKLLAAMFYIDTLTRITPHGKVVHFHASAAPALIKMLLPANIQSLIEQLIDPSRTLERRLEPDQIFELLGLPSP